MRELLWHRVHLLRNDRRGRLAWQCTRTHTVLASQADSAYFDDHDWSYYISLGEIQHLDIIMVLA